MLSFPAESLSKGAVLVKGDLDPNDKVWLKGDQRPSGHIRVSGRLSAAGAGRFYFSGRFSGSAQGECRRCLVEVRREIGANAQLLFADAGIEDDEPDVFPVSHGRGGDVVDLRPALREQWLLEVPAFVLCRPDCKGLCRTCGANLNAGACSCTLRS